MKTLSVFLLAAVLGASGAVALAAGWTSNLAGGGVVTVDPDTLRATVTRDGVTTPLWNGVHRMEDGSALIVNQGEAVPGMPASSPPRQLPPPKSEDWEGALIAGFSPCEKLARRVCGRHNECAQAEACSPAQQLLAMEQEERAQAVDHSRMTYTSGQCKQASNDTSYFSVCRTRQ
jgi:hypothetical protein